jgi:hypothetical protein
MRITAFLDAKPYLKHRLKVFLPTVVEAPGESKSNSLPPNENQQTREFIINTSFPINTIDT